MGVRPRSSFVNIRRNVKFRKVVSIDLLMFFFPSISNVDFAILEAGREWMSRIFGSKTILHPLGK